MLEKDLTRTEEFEGSALVGPAGCGKAERSFGILEWQVRLPSLRRGDKDSDKDD